MKHPCLKMLFASLFFLASVPLAFAQLPAANTFPPTGKAGIGTTNPLEAIHIKDGTIRIDKAAKASGSTGTPADDALAVFDSLGNLRRATEEQIRELLENEWTPIPDPGAGEFWRISGNTNITGSHFLGTTTPTDLRLRSNSLERMSITSDGFIHFGLVNAIKGMDISAVSTDPDASGLFIDADNISGGYGITCNVSNGLTKALSIQSNGLEQFYVDGEGKGYFSQRLGIGVSMPLAVLHISHNDANGGIILNRNSATTGKSQVSFRKSGIETWAIGTDLNQNNANNFFIYGGNTFQPRLFIDHFGNMGIGTVNPAALLDVEGAIKIGMYAGSNPAIGPQIGMLRYNSVFHEFEGYKNDPATNQNGWVKITSQSLWKMNGVNMYYNEGSIGLGTDFPASTLDVRGNGRFGTNTDYVQIGYDGAHTVIDNYGIGANGDGLLMLNYYSGNDVVIGNGTPASSSLVVSGSLGVGTGQYLDTYKFAVAGKMISEEVRVKMKANWPDYVFEETHELMPVGELKAFIKENKHLPNIPSAEEVKKNDGIDLGEMNAKLLEKIEELTLYMIEQQRQIDELKAKVCD